jgi:hypothetical protein
MSESPGHYPQQRRVGQGMGDYLDCLSAVLVWITNVPLIVGTAYKFSRPTLRSIIATLEDTHCHSIRITTSDLQDYTKAQGFDILGSLETIVRQN